MKKNVLFLACCIGMMLLASCKKDPVAPTIGVYTGEGCVTENTQVYSGDEVLVGFTLTGENLTQIEIVLSQGSTVLASHSDNPNSAKTDPVTSVVYKHSFAIQASGTVTVTGTVIDANGLTATKSFSIVYNEKPNAKFVGVFEGEALFNGTMSANIVGMDPMEEEVTDRAVPVTLTLREGDAVTEVVGSCKIEDQEMEIKGTVDGNSVTFEAINTTYTFNYDMGGFSISPEMNLTYNVKATLDGETLSLDGTCVGDGEIHLFLYNGTIGLDGTIGGSLNKTR